MKEITLVVIREIFEFIKIILLFLKNNVSWIKDFMWIVFTFLATIIGIFTYKNAKKTLFQPLNSEVIKRQTNLFVEIYDLLNGNLNVKLEYHECFLFTAFRALQDLEYDINIPEKLECKFENINKYDRCVFGTPIEDDEDSLSDEEDLNEESCEKGAMFYQFKDNIIVKGEPVDVVIIFNSSENQRIFDRINELICDPLLPSELKVKLEKLSEEIFINFTDILYENVNKVVNEIWLCDINDVDEINDKCYKACNEYINQLYGHSKLQKDIFEFISKYLKVDNLF